MKSWWSLGEGRGYRGNALDPSYITCPFCMERGNFSHSYHAEKQNPASGKKLNFDTLECGNCKGYVMVLWSASNSFGGGLWSYKVLPYPLDTTQFPEHWPPAIGRYWLQAVRSLQGQNWDAAALMARSALQIALRDNEAEGRTLKAEIADLASKGLLPPTMKDWSEHVRELGNDSAHPHPDQDATRQADAEDIVEFLDFLLNYLYTLPHRIGEYRARREGGNAQPAGDA